MPGPESDAAERKKAWRRLARDLFALTPPEARRGLDALLCGRIEACVAGTGAKFLLGYAPLRDEPDIMPFLRKWTARGGRLALPVWLGGGEMILRAVDDVDARLRPGRGGILEPVPECPGADAGEVDFVVVPGRFFSERLERLGRGAGCYDRLLARRGAASLGAAYDFQVVPALPVDANDVPVDMVATPARVIANAAERRNR